MIRSFFEGETHDAIAAREGVSRSAITQRVKKGVEDIRATLERRGVAVSGAVLGTLLSTNGVEASPEALVHELTKYALAGPTSVPATGAATITTGQWGVRVMSMSAFMGLLILGATYTWSGSESAPIAAVHEDPAPIGVASAFDPPNQSPPLRSAAGVDARTERLDENVFVGEFRVAQSTVENEAVVPYTLRGRMLSDTGYPRGSVEIFPIDDLSAHDRLSDSAIDGTFMIQNVQPSETTWFAQNRPSRSAALFTLPARHDGALERDVRLDMTLTELTGRVFDSSGEPVALAEIAVRVEREDGTVGIFRVPSWGVTTREGFYTMTIATEAGAAVSLGVHTPGGGDVAYWSGPVVAEAGAYSWTFPDTMIPSELAVAISEAAPSHERYDRIMSYPALATYGGVVVDETGRPIKGVEIEMHFGGAYAFTNVGNAVTDGRGRFSVMLPTELTHLNLRILHRDYLNSWLTPERSHRVPLDELADQTAVIQLERGTRLSGYVRDASGNPVPDALIDPGTITSYASTDQGSIPTENANTARTNADGYFELGCLPLGEANLLVLVAGYAPAATSVELKGDTGPISISVERGATIRGRFVDPSGQPLENAYLYSEQWGEDHRVNIRAESGPDGTFELANVPTEGAIQYHFGQTGARGKWMSMGGTLEPREEPYEITLYPVPVIRGTVVDDVTGEPVREFKVTPGWKWELQGEYQFDRMGREETVKSSRGRFSKRITGMSVSVNAGERPKLPFVVKISADGYYPAVSPEIFAGDNPEDIEIRLTPGVRLTGTIVDESGTLVEGATVAQIRPGEMAHVVNGLLYQEAGNAPVNVVETKSDGAFAFPPLKEPGAIVALHKSGYAVYETNGDVADLSLSLTPWAKVVGVATVSESAARQGVRMGTTSIAESSSVGFIRWIFESVLPSDGVFEYDFVPADEFTVENILIEGEELQVLESTTLTVQSGMEYTVELAPGP